MILVSLQELVRLALCAGIWKVRPVLSRNRLERGTRDASSVVTQQEFLGSCVAALL